MIIAITGGHLTPALAVIGELQKKHPEIELIFIGRKFSQTYPPQLSREEKEMEIRKIPFYPIDAAKYHREPLWMNITEILKFPLSFYQVGRLFKEKRPTVVLSFGGYISFPVCVIAKIFQARIVTHEQTKTAGLANQILAHLADVVAVSSEESLIYFPKEKTIITGNPVRQHLLREYKTPPPWMGKDISHLPFLYVTGGSQGSQIINQTIASILPKIVKNYVVIHQCGSSNESVYMKELEKVKQRLPEELQPRYIIREWIEAKEVSFLLRNALFVISRAGANTVQELTFAGTPAIFIPLATSHHNEQQKNCAPLVEAGSSICLLQKDLVPDSLYEAIQTLMRHYPKMKEKASKVASQMHLDGTKRVIDLLLQ